MITVSIVALQASSTSSILVGSTTANRTHKISWGFLVGSKLLEAFAIRDGWSHPER